MSIRLSRSLPILLWLLTACAPDSATVPVTLRTGLESQGQFKNLLNGLARPPALNALASVGGTCVQKNLYAAVDPTPEGGADQLETIRIPLNLGYDGAASYTIDAAWVQSYSSSPPIVVPVPRGIPVGVGIVGALYASQSKDSGQETCADFDASGVPNPYGTSSVIGHTRVVANGPVEVPLKVWVTPVGVAPQATPNSGDANCEDESSEDQSCPKNNFMKLTCAGCSPSQDVQLEYAMDRNQPSRRVIQWVRAIDTNAMWVPDTLPLRVNLRTPHGPLSKTILPGDLTGNGNRTTSWSYSASDTGSNAMVFTLTQFSRRLIPTIGNFGMATILGTAPGAATVTWSAAPFATSYTVRWDTTGTTYPNTVTTVNGTSASISGFAAGATYFLIATAGNNLGSAPKDANPYILFEPFPGWTTAGGTAPAPSGSGTTINANFGTQAPSAITSNPTKSFVAYAQDSLGNVYASAPTTSLFATINGLTSGVAYRIWVVATNANGGYSISPQSGPYTP